MPNPRPKILAYATQGSGGPEVLDDELRLRTLLGEFDASYVRFDRGNRLGSFRRVLRALKSERPDMVVMEGTGLAGGAALLLGRALFGTRYVLSSGDAVAPFVRAQAPLAHPLFLLYEALLCRHAAGFVGWSPYVVGRALTLGAPAAMTAPGWPPYPPLRNRDDARRLVRERLGIAPNAMVFGVVGSLAWNRRVHYCYGLELAQALPLAAERTDLHVLIVGDGDGRAHIERLRSAATSRLHLTGRVPRPEVGDYLAAMDVVTLPQSVDAVGNFRYTTKLSEYLGSGVPVVVNQIPLAYDLPGEWVFRLPGRSPWDPAFVEALAKLMREVSREELEDKRRETEKALPLFQRDPQVQRFTRFLLDRLAASAPTKP